MFRKQNQILKPTRIYEMEGALLHILKSPDWSTMTLYDFGAELLGPEPGT